MGLIQRQGFKHSLVTFFGMAIGAVNMLFLYPRIFSQEELGIFQYIARNAQLLFPFSMLGAGALAIRFYPQFREMRGGHRGFLSFIALWAMAGFVLFILIALLLDDWILSFFQYKSPLFRLYLPYLLPVVVSMGLGYLLATYCANFGRIVVPALFNNFFLKMSLGLMALAVWAAWIPFSGFMAGMVVVYFLVVLLIYAYLYWLGEARLVPAVKKPDPRLLRGMISYAGFSLMGGAGAVLATQIDVFMVGLLTTLSNVAIYSIGFLIADTIDVPRRSLEQIAAPLVAQAWQQGNREHINDLYRKSAVNQSAVGLLLLLCIWLPLDSLFDLIPNGEAYEASKAVVFILGIGKLFEMMSGINRLIIVYSSFYRFDFYATLILAGLNVVSNFIFIPLFQVAGAAMATTFTILIYDLLKVWFVWSRFRLHPFSVQTGYLFVLAFGILLIGYVVPDVPLPIVDIALKVALASALFIGGIYYFRLAPELILVIEQVWKKLKDGLSGK